VTGNPSASSYSSSRPGADGPTGGAGGPGGSGGPGAGGGSGRSECDFAFETVLASPVAAEVADLRIGDVLWVVLQDSPPAVIAVTAAGNIIGGITQAATDLRNCLQQGVEYTAAVVDINGGAVRVFVQTADA
jgi:hypothetical protein